MPKSDGYENSEVLLLTAEEAVKRENITNMSHEILKAYMGGCSKLAKSGYIPASDNEKTGSLQL